MRQDELYHFGILGMKWGIRRFQNKDGTLTKAGKKRYDDNGDEWTKQTASNKRLDEFVTNTLSKHVDDVIADYKKENKYGAIVDPNDWISNMADMPLIMFDPESRTSNKGFTRFN